MKERQACPNHVHRFVEMAAKISVLHFMGMKRKSGTQLYEQFDQLK